MAIISSLGVGSNLDLNGLLTQLTGAERLPLKAIDARAASYTTKLSAYGKLQSSLDNLQATAWRAFVMRSTLPKTWGCLRVSSTMAA